MSVTSIHFCEARVKTGARVYQTSVLDPVVNPFNDILFDRVNWVFQQDSAPAYKAKTIQTQLENNFPHFIKVSDLSSANPNLNLLDYELGNILKKRVCKKRHPNLESFERSILKAATEIPLETIRTYIERQQQRLHRNIEKEGGILNI